MGRCTWVVLYVALIGPTCAQPGLPRETLVHGGLTREYYVFEPPGGERPRPLVLALHGGGGQASTMDASTNGQFGREASRRGWLVCYPQGVERRWNDGRGVKEGAPDDVGFLAALIDKLIADRGADRTRVYATGISNGGFMSFRLGVELSERVVAVAPVTATLPKVFEDQALACPVGLMVINGTADPLVPFEGGTVMAFGRPRGGPILSTAASVRWWVERSGCVAVPAVEELRDADPGDGCRATARRFPAGATGVEVVCITVAGGGHTWPGGRQYLPEWLIGPVCRDLDGTALICEFFARQVRRPSALDEALR